MAWVKSPTSVVKQSAVAVPCVWLIGTLVVVSWRSPASAGGSIRLICGALQLSQRPRGARDRLHHFIGAGLWDSAPLEATLWRQADALVGGDRAWLIIDDTALPKKGKASVGVAPQYATALGKNANCQTLVSVTLASGEVPVMLGLRLFLPENWTKDAARMARAGVPEPFQAYSPDYSSDGPFWVGERSLTY